MNPFQALLLTFSPKSPIAAGPLPVQLQAINAGQTAQFQAKTVEYFRELVARHEIDPRRVTEIEFLQKALVLAQKDPNSGNWAAVALMRLGELQSEALRAQRAQADRWHQIDMAVLQDKQLFERRRVALDHEKMFVASALSSLRKAVSQGSPEASAQETAVAGSAFMEANGSLNALCVTC
jgi:hypothetical protein